MYKTLHWLANFCAGLAGLLLTGITLMVCYSVLGRELAGKPITGDFELTAMAAGAGVALFMPLAQIMRGNIIVDFFTAKASPAAQNTLDRLGALLLGLVMAALAWRSVHGLFNALQNHSETPIMGFPIWYTYIFIAAGLGLTAVIALTQASLGFDTEAHDEASDALKSVETSPSLPSTSGATA